MLLRVRKFLIKSGKLHVYSTDICKNTKLTHTRKIYKQRLLSEKTKGELAGMH